MDEPGRTAERWRCIFLFGDRLPRRPEPDAGDCRLPSDSSR
eukprot:gene52012-6999_t